MLESCVDPDESSGGRGWSGICGFDGLESCCSGIDSGSLCMFGLGVSSRSGIVSFPS